jgi:hypothetical protein
MRGEAVDELQARIGRLKERGKEIPAEWQDKLRQLAETDSPQIVEDVRSWMAGTLPPVGMDKEEITWQTYSHFGSALHDSLVIYASRLALLADEQYAESLATATAMIRQILSMRDNTKSPEVAMSELSKIESRAKRELKGFIVGE